MAENKFDESILVNILSRIPADSVLTSKTICKTWETLIKDPYFVRSHTHRLLNNYYHSASEIQDDSATRTVPRPPPSFVFLVGGTYESPRRYRELYIGEYCYESKQIIRKQLNCAHFNSSVSFAGSCNGLVCLAVLTQCRLWDPIYVFNPITRESVNLPRFSERKNLGDDMAYGFGYHPPTKKYKVVRIFYGEVRQLQVYTLGDTKGKWRNRGQVLYFINRSHHGVFCNGALHWFIEDGIVSFDLGDEDFKMLPPLPIDAKSRFGISCKLGELNGCLYVTHRKVDGHVDLTDLWTLRKKKKNRSDDVDEYFWNKDYRMELEFNPLKIFIPVSISENHAKLLSWSYGIEGTELVEHDQKYPNVLKPLNDDYKHLYLGKNFWAAPYIKSLVLLKALGENAKLMEAKGSVEFMNVEGDAT